LNGRATRSAPGRLTAVVAALVLVATAAGCGGRPRGDDGGYVQAVNAAQKDFRDRFDRLSDGITATSTPAQDRRTLAGFQDAVDRVVARLRASRPPARVAGLHRSLVRQIAGYAGPIEVARRAFASRDPRRVLAAQGRLRAAVSDTGGRVNRTIDAINAKLGGG
jgi:hypothetical protein